MFAITIAIISIIFFLRKYQLNQETKKAIR